MTCRRARGLLLEGVTGRLDPDRRRALLAHLAGCERCRAEAAELEEGVALLRAVPEPVAPEGFWGDFMAGLEGRLRAEPLPLGVRLRRWFARPPRALGTAAATAALVAVLTLAVGQQRSAPPETTSPPGRLAAYVTPEVRGVLPALSHAVELWQAGMGALEQEPLFDLPPDAP